MSKYMTKKQVELFFKKNILPSLNKKDKKLIKRAWDNYTDYLCTEGYISKNQYNNWVYPRFCKRY